MQFGEGQMERSLLLWKGRSGLLVVGAALAASTTLDVASALDAEVGRHGYHSGRPFFQTPGKAAYCWLADTLAPENPVLGCWTPNDGFYVTIQHASGPRAQRATRASSKEDTHRATAIPCCASAGSSRGAAYQSAQDWPRAAEAEESACLLA